MDKITDKSKFIKIVGILSNSDINDENCIYITNFIVNLSKQLEEKDKVIDEIKNALINYKNEWVEDDQVIKDINKFLEILKRGKNANS